MPIPIPPVWNPMGELKPLLTPMVPIPPMVGPAGKVEGIVPPCMGIVLVPEFKESFVQRCHVQKAAGQILCLEQ